MWVWPASNACYRQKMRELNGLIVVAGMEGALGSAVGGMVRWPLIAVPTSVGYGSFSGNDAVTFDDVLLFDRYYGG